MYSVFEWVLAAFNSNDEEILRKIYDELICHLDYTVIDLFQARRDWKSELLNFGAESFIIPHCCIKGDKSNQMLLTLLLASLFVLCDTRDDESQKLLWSRYGDYLCDFISNKSTRQRLKLCQTRRSNGEVLRSKRDVNASLPSNFSTTPTIQDSKATYPPPTTKQRSYVGCPKDSPVDPNGYEIKGKGISINVDFTRIDNAWIANLHWKRHTDNSESKCIGYRVRWFRIGAVLGDQYCDEIMNENTTTYMIDASKGWKNEYNELYVVVFPLPRRSRSESYGFRTFPVPTAITTRPNTVTRTSSKQNETNSGSLVNTTTRPNTATTLTKTSSTRDGEAKSEPVKKNTVSSWFVAIIVVAILVVVIFVILMAYRWIRSGSRLSVSESKMTSVKETLNRKRGTDYISYYSDNERDTNTAMKIAAWLAQHEVKVIMDKFDVITNGKRIWSEQQLASAKKVILIISPGYLEICKFDQNIKKEKKLDSFMDQLAYNEICYIRDEIRKNPLAIDRFIVVLAEVGSGELPFWMKGLKNFVYSNGVLDGEILKFLNDIGNNNAADHQSV